MDSIGERLKARRKALGLTQADLAGTDVSAGMVSLIERDMVSPTFKNIEFLSRRLGLSISELVGEDNSSKNKYEIRHRTDIEKIEAVCTSLCNVKRYQEALDILEDVVVEPQLTVFMGNIYYLKAKALYEIGKCNAAIRTLTETQQYIQNKDITSVRNINSLFAKCHFKKGNYEEAKDASNFVITLQTTLSNEDVDIAEMKYIQAYCLFIESKFIQVQELVNSVLASDVQMSIVLSSKLSMLQAMTLLKMGQLSKAKKTLQMLQQVGIMEPKEMANVAMYLGICHRLQAEYDESLECFAASEKLVAEKNTAHLNFETLLTYYTAKNYEEVRERAKGLIKQKDKVLQSLTHLVLAAVSFQEGNEVSTQECIDAAQKIATKHKIHWLLLLLHLSAVKFELVNDRFEAWETLTKDIVTILPSNYSYDFLFN
ncbi:MAG: helix-turn-helix domain-containing protein [Bacilli bacterium]